MCHCIIFRIKPRVSKYHALCFHRVTWWQLGLNSKEDIVLHRANCWYERWQGRSLSDSQHSFSATSSSCGNKCAHRRRSIVDQQVAQQGTVAQMTQGQHTGCIFPLKRNIEIVSVTLRESRPWLIVLVDLWREKHRVRQVQAE